MVFDFEAAVGAPFRMQPGLRRIAPGVAQLTPLAPDSRHQREKLAVLSAFADEALIARPGFDAGPALDALCAHAAHEHPDAFAWDGRRACAPRLGVAVDADGRVEQTAPGAFGIGDEIPHCLAALGAGWRRAGLLSLAFAEDFAVADAGDGSIPWIAAALPSGWAPEEKVGRSFAEVHAPVADAALVVGAAKGLMRLVAGPGRWERFVWTVTPNPRLHAHPKRVDPRRWELVPVERAWFRSERQTFIAMPERQQAIFTIAVDVQPLAEVVAPPGRAARLHDAVATMSDAVLAYRALEPVREELLGWLATRR